MDETKQAELFKILAQVRTCGRRGTGRFHEVELEKEEDKLARLYQYEKEFKEELEEVPARLKKNASEDEGLSLALI
ncbi:MAG: hypothetical protein AB1641_22460 [Thermodesulfobacteriota bacterium]